MKISNITGFLFLSALIGNCVDDGDLHRTIFIRDKNYPDLPQYSEWGYNTFGAFINDEVFISGNYYWNPASLSSVDTNMILSFQGEKISNEKDTSDMIMNFIFPRNSPWDRQYMLSLNNTMIDLSTSSAQVIILSDTTAYPVTVHSGELQFTRVQSLMVNNVPEETIFSGTFEFEGLMNGSPVSVTHGRFDVGVSYFNY